jgi:hypothetical protein
LGHDEVEGEFDELLADPAFDVVGGAHQLFPLLDPLGLLAHLLVDLVANALQSGFVLVWHPSLLVEHLQQVFLADVALQHLVDVLFLAFLVLWLAGDELAFAGDGVLDGVFGVDAVEVSANFLTVLRNSVLPESAFFGVVVHPLIKPLVLDGLDKYVKGDCVFEEVVGL